MLCALIDADRELMFFEIIHRTGINTASHQGLYG